MGRRELRFPLLGIRLMRTTESGWYRTCPCPIRPSNRRSEIIKSDDCFRADLVLITYLDASQGAAAQIMGMQAAEDPQPSTADI